MELRLSATNSPLMKHFVSGVVGRKRFLAGYKATRCCSLGSALARAKVPGHACRKPNKFPLAVNWLDLPRAAWPLISLANIFISDCGSKVHKLTERFKKGLGEREIIERA